MAGNDGAGTSWTRERIEEKYSGYTSSDEHNFESIDEAQGAVAYYEREIELLESQASRCMYILRKARAARDLTKARYGANAPGTGNKCAGSVCEVAHAHQAHPVSAVPPHQGQGTLRCQYCDQVYDGECIPFPHCRYCDARPSFHHGRCCPHRATWWSRRRSGGNGEESSQAAQADQNAHQSSPGNTSQGSARARAVSRPRRYECSHGNAGGATQTSGGNVAWMHSGNSPERNQQIPANYNAPDGNIPFMQNIADDLRGIHAEERIPERNTTAQVTGLNLIAPRSPPGLGTES